MDLILAPTTKYSNIPDNLGSTTRFSMREPKKTDKYFIRQHVISQSLHFFFFFIYMTILTCQLFYILKRMFTTIVRKRNSHIVVCMFTQLKVLRYRKFWKLLPCFYYCKKCDRNTKNLHFNIHHYNSIAKSMRIV